MASHGGGLRGHPRGTGQAPPTFDQQAFTEAVGIAVTAIAHACAIVSQGWSNYLQRLEAHRLPMVRGGVDSRVRTTMTTEGEVDFMRGIQDMGASTKGKGDQPSSSSGKSRRLLVCKGSRAPVIRARDELGLLVRMSRWCATIARSPDI